MSKKKIKVEDIPNKSEKLLFDDLLLLKKELFNLRFQKSLGELKDFSKFSKVRKNIARIKTELNKRIKIK